MDVKTEIRLAKAPYNWLRISPALTVFTLFLVATSNIGAALCNNALFACGGEDEIYINFGFGVLISSLWHLLLLQYVNNKDSEFVRKHGRAALRFAGIRTAVALSGVILDWVTNASGGFACIFIIVLLFLWAINQTTKQDIKEMEDSSRSSEVAEETSLRPSAKERITSISSAESYKILNDLQSDDDVTVILAIEKAEVLEDVYDATLKQAILRELELLAEEDDNKDIQVKARAAFNHLTQASLVLNSDTKSDAQATLAQLLQGLQSEDENKVISALEALKTLTFSNEAIRSQLEKIGLHGSNRKVRSEARALLNYPANRAVMQRFNQNHLDRKTREFLLGEIKAWTRNELIEKEIADVLSRRYDFDIAPLPAQPKPFDAAQDKPIQTQPAAVTPQATPTPVAPAPSVPQSPPAPPEPRPSLLQTLTSEASIKIYLYLGAFFVISAAAILGAVVPEFRLPILILGTFIFGGLAIAIKKRLPQPSFALFIVFSFLLPITANSLEETLREAFKLNQTFSHGYWVFIFLLMAAIWSASVWLYESRLFSITAFGALILSFWQLGNLFEAETAIYSFLMGLAALAGLTGARRLKKWKDDKFVLPLFLASQILQVANLAASLGSFGIDLFEPANNNILNLVTFAVWALGTVFYIFSEKLYPFFAFPWLMAATLIPMPWFISVAFDLESLGSSLVLFVWGGLLAAASEITRRLESTKKYGLPVLLASLPGLTLAVFTGFVYETGLGMGIALAVAILFTTLHILQTRWWLWILALLSFTIAYFAFFELEFMQTLGIVFGYELVGITILFLLPDLILKKDWQENPQWRLPLRIAGTLFLLTTSLALFTQSESRHVATVSFILAFFCTAYALAYRNSYLAYLPAAYLSLAVIHTINAFNLDAWLPALTALSVLYYLAGSVIRKNEKWGAMLRNSGMTLGTLLSFTALILMKETGGWYALVIGLVFIIEMYLSRNGWFEIGTPVLFTLGAFLILNDLNVDKVAYQLLTYSLIWVLTDLLVHLTYRQLRPLGIIVRGVAGGLTAINAVLLLTISTELDAAICFGVYTLIFTVDTFVYRNPPLGYIPAASLPLTIWVSLTHFNIDAWLPALTGLAVIYFLAGLALRANKDWSYMLRNSALTLGSVLSLAALFILKETGGWYALVTGLLFIAEMYLRKDGMFEIGVPVLFTLGIFLILRDFNIERVTYHLLAYSLVWIVEDILAHLTFANPRPLKLIVQFIGGGMALMNSLYLFLETDSAAAALGFGVYTLLSLTVSLVYQKPALLYTFTITLPLFTAFLFRLFGMTQWIHPVIAVAILFYAAGFILRKRERAVGWDEVLWQSGLGLGVVVSIAAPILGGVDASIPVAIAATFWAVEAYARKNAWLAFPANGLYLLAYFIILSELNVDEPQFFSIGTALFGLVQHYLLTRAEIKTGAFIMGMFSQFVLLGTTYIELVNKSDLNYFFLLFLQSLIVLVYGIVIRSRSLTLFPIGFATLGVITVVYSALKDIGTIFVIGCTGILLLMLGVGAVLLRERITKLSEKLSDWKA